MDPKDELYVPLPKKKYKTLKNSGYMVAHTAMSKIFIENGTALNIGVYLETYLNDFDPKTIPNGGLSDTFFKCRLIDFLFTIQKNIGKITSTC